LSGGSWLAPALGAQLAYSLSIYSEMGVLARERMSAATLAAGSAVLNATVAGVLLLLLGVPDAPLHDLALLVLSGALLYLYLLPYLKALELDDASAVAPLFQLVPPLTLVLGILLLGDHASAGQVAGFGVVLGGALVFVAGDPRRGRTRLRTAGWMALSSLVLAARLTLLDDLLSSYSFTDSAPLIAAGLGLAGVLTCLRPTTFRALRRARRSTWSGIGIAQGLNLGAEALLVVAIGAGPAFLVAVTTGVQPGILLLLGALLTHWGPPAMAERADGPALLLRWATSVTFLGGVVVAARAAA
jgi:drug/metabolite transporter (DMT)-like permease